MNRIVALFLLAVLPATATAQENINQPYLVPNTSGHTSLVNRLLFTPDGKQLISVSSDKTIRVWDVARGATARVLRPPIGKGKEGELMAAALSPDGKTLAVGGVAVGNGRLGHPIYLIDLAAGRIERTLLGHRNNVTGLAFSPDGKRLASTSSDRTVRIWDPAAGTTEKTLEGHTDGMWDVVWSPDGKRLATASYDKTARLWSLESGQSEVVLKGHEDAVQCVAWSPDGKTIATGGRDQALILWEPDGKLRKKFDKLGNWVTSLKFTSTSKSLLFTRGSHLLHDRTATLLTVETGKERVRFTQHNNSVFASAIAPDNALVATAGGNSHEIYLWTIPGGEVVARLSGPATGFNAAGWSRDGAAVAWGTARTGNTRNNAAPLERTFRLADLEFGEPPNDTYARAQMQQGGLTLDLADTAVAVKQGGRTLTTLTLFSKSDYVRSSTFLAADRVAVGSNYSLDVYDVTTGRRLRTLIGHTYEVRGVAPAPNRRWLLSASVDETLRLWDTQGPLAREPGGIGIQFKMEDGLPVVTAIVANTAAARDGRLRVGDRLAASAEVKGEFVEFKDRTQAEVGRALSGPLNSIVRLKVLPEGKEEPAEYILQRGSVQLERAEPFLSLFFAGNEWVAWTPEGFYAASPGGERLVGWHVNNGTDQLGTFYPADRFTVLYRPDVISRLAETGNVDRAVALADLVRGQKTERLDIADVLPPRVKITSPDRPGVELNEDGLEVTAEAQMTGKQPIRAMRLLVDGRPYKGLEGVRKFDGPGEKQAKASWKVRLIPGRHRLVVQADSAVSQGDSAALEVNYVLGTPPQGRLFVLAVGIAAYADEKLKLYYAAKDAQAISARLKEKARPAPFQDVVVRVLTDKQATRAAILEELKKLQQQMKPEDSAILFYSGHGERDDKGGLYLLPADVDLKKLKDTGVSGDELKTALVGLPGMVLLVLDTCHSGALGAGKLYVNSVSDEIARELGRDENGVIVMCSSMARQDSVEDNEHRQGTFTLALLEGLAGKGSKGLDGVVYQHHLDSYVLDRVRQLTKGRQTPTTAKPGNLPPFPLSKP
jgi:WD40 repeat protein